MRLTYIFLTAAACCFGVAHAHQMTLACHYVEPPMVGGNAKDSNFVVDFDANTVDGTPATISDGRVLWEQNYEKTHGLRVAFVLDRLNGRLTGKIISEGKTIPPQIEGQCTRAPERRS